MTKPYIHIYMKTKLYPRCGDSTACEYRYLVQVQICLLGKHKLRQCTFQIVVVKCIAGLRNSGL